MIIEIRLNYLVSSCMHSHAEALAWLAIGNKRSPPTLRTTFVYGLYIDEVLTMDRLGLNNYYYHGDDLHNTMRITDHNGAIVEGYDYGDYGQPQFLDNMLERKPLRLKSVVLNPYLFQGRRYNEDTGLYYFRNRNLAPQTGRFTTRDPIGIWGDTNNMGNGFTFAGSNPWTLVDPLGLDSGGGNSPWHDWVNKYGTYDQNFNDRMSVFGDRINPLDPNLFSSDPDDFKLNKQIYDAWRGKADELTKEMAEEVGEDVFNEMLVATVAGPVVGATVGTAKKGVKHALKRAPKFAKKIGRSKILPKSVRRFLSRFDPINRPDDDGFAGKPKSGIMPKGGTFDHYGDENGFYVSPSGTPFEQRSLWENETDRPLNRYEVIKPFRADEGEIAPWYGKPGGGYQARFTHSIKWYIDNDFVRRLD